MGLGIQIKIVFPYRVGDFEVTIGANEDQAEEEAVEDKDKDKEEEEAATTILRNTYNGKRLLLLL